jgi:hypothetical protein
MLFAPYQQRFHSYIIQILQKEEGVCETFYLIRGGDKIENNNTGWLSGFWKNHYPFAAGPIFG